MYFFDLDGTLLDSNGIWLDIDIQFLGRHGISPVPEEYTDYVTHHTFHDAAEHTRRVFSLPLTAEEIIAASGIEQGDNLFLISPVQTGRKIASVLPYVDNVNVRRALPDGVVITVTECMPAAVIQGNGSWWIIDAKGKVLEQTASGTGAAVVSGLTALLPVEGTRLAVEDADSAKLNSLLQLLRAFSDRGMAEKVSSIDLTSTANIILEYDGRFTVKIPMNPENFALKVRALDETVAQLQTNESGSIDLTREDKVYFDQTGGGK